MFPREMVAFPDTVGSLFSVESEGVSRHRSHASSVAAGYGP